MIETIQKAKKEKWIICVYGLGAIGKTAEKVIPGCYGLEVDYYCDKNENVLSDYCVKDISKISYNELIHTEEDILVFLFVGQKLSYQISKDLSCNRKLHVVSFYELLDDDDLITAFFDIVLPKRITE